MREGEREVRSREHQTCQSLVESATKCGIVVQIDEDVMAMPVVYAMVELNIIKSRIHSWLSWDDYIHHPLSNSAVVLTHQSSSFNCIVAGKILSGEGRSVGGHQRTRRNYSRSMAQWCFL